MGTYLYYRYEKKKVILTSEQEVTDVKELKSKLKKQYDANLWGIVDVLTITVSHDYLVNRGDVVCVDSVEKFANELIKLLKAGKLPNLNPVLDEVYRFKTEENTNIDAFSSFIMQKSEFSTEAVDKNKDFLNIKISMDIMWTNVLPFIGHKEIRIEKAIIQTGLFRKEIK